MADPDVDSTTPVRGAAPAVSARGPRAHTFFWAVLITAAAVSVTGNATQAVLHDTQVPAIAAVVAVIPPLALLAAVHGVSVLSRAHAHARGTYRLATAMTVLIAAGAFWLSFTALRSLAIIAGIPPGEAWLWPVIIEGSMGQATVALLSLARSPTSEDEATNAPVPPVRTRNEDAALDHHGTTGERTACADRRNDLRKPLEPAVRTPESLLDTVRTPPEPAVRTPESLLDTVRTPPEPAVRTPDFVPSTVQTVPGEGERTPENLSLVAERVCARDPAGRRDPDQVAQILTLHYLDGLNPSQIAQRVTRSRTTVSRILSDARDLHAEGPLAPRR
ncbi:DUF2637 domain-containing protein [Nocardia sputi]|uniref:DUF2637 domain-containing protein n=1 Tax=Nocardia sputi TaxID=2943705 RepID=UPI0020BD5835|nr:DUF2637 domain-containing protein [Nocardia sputi]